MNSSNGGAYPLSSLYVGDLHPDINESMLHEKFQTAGPVISLRICRDMVTRRSLGYAYVNYESVTDAERAIDTMNFDVIRGKPIRIMWSHRDPSLRKSGVGNIFIKNLDKSIDTKAMYDTFSAFGAILSCKVAQDETGQSRGYGFVHFEAEESARRAIEKINGMLLNDKQVYVGKFISNRERAKEMGDKSKNFKNIYIKNLAESVDDEKLKEMFEKFGVITSAKVMYEDEENTKSRGFGFVAFENAESAVQAVEEMNGKLIENRNLYVNRAQKKNERQTELNRKFEMIKQERVNKFQGINLYVKNLDDTIDDERLKQEFSAFGKITSAKVMMEDGHSKGFGFVCFSTPEESAKAVTDMYGKIVGSKPLYVALAQRKEERKHHLESQYTQRMTTMRMQQQMTGGLYPPNNAAAAAAAAGYFMPTMGPPARFFNPAATPMGHIRPQGRWPGSNSGLGGVGGGPAGVAQGAPMRPMNAGVNQVPGMPGGLNQVTFAPGNQYAPSGVLPNSYRHSNMPQRSMSSRVNQNGPSPNVVNASVPSVPMGASVVNGAGGAGRPITGSMQQSMGQQQRPMPIPSATVPQGAGRVSGAATNAAAPTYTKFNPSVRNGPVAAAAGAGNAGAVSGQQLVGHNQEAVLVQDQEPLTLAMLSAANIDEQKQMLGERLFPIIQGIYPDLCGKITGMLLEIDNTELIHMLEHRESLKNKVDEAVAVLQAASQKSQHLTAKN